MSIQTIIQQDGRRPPSNFNLRTGRILRQKRISAGLSQEEVGDRIGVSHQCYQRYEAGKIVINLPGLVNLGHAIGFDPVAFLNEVMGDCSPIRRVQREVNDIWAAKVAEAVTHMRDAKDKKMVFGLVKRLAGKA